MSIKKEQKKRSKAIIEALEPRILFSADMLGGLVDGNVPDDPLAGLLEDSAILIDSSRSSDNQAQEPMGATPDRQQDQQQETADPLLIPSTENETEIQTYELLVVDTATPDYQQLIDSLVEDTSRRFELLLIEKDDNGLQLITEKLQDLPSVDSIHLISHGSAGTIQLGNETVDLAALQDYPALFNIWGEALSHDGDILIYGCDVASTADGKALIEALAEVTQADVAASDDLTG
ncbi:MAG: DUF4347 domain-containing protein, partial [Candidatus Thiodiazotropha sp.]